MQVHQGSKDHSISEALSTILQSSNTKTRFHGANFLDLGGFDDRAILGIEKLSAAAFKLWLFNKLMILS